MRLTKNIVRTYQSLAFFLALALILNMPIIILASLTPMIFIAIYSTIAWRRLKRIPGKRFRVMVQAYPNPAAKRSKVRVKLIVEQLGEEPIPVEIYFLLDGLRVLEGSERWIGVLGDAVLTEFSITSDKIGVSVLGPLYIAVKDGLGLVVREMELHPPIPLLFLSDTPWRSAPPTSQTITGHPSPGHSRTPFMGLRDEYRVSLPYSQHPTLRDVDWRRTARTGGEEVYVREYDRRRKADIVLGVGTGLENVEEQIITEILHLAYTHLTEGSNPWIMFYVRERLVAMPLTRGVAGVGLEKPGDPPTGGIIIHVSRLRDLGEVKALSELSRVSDLRVIIPTSTATLDESIELRASRIGLRFNVVELKELPQALRTAPMVHGGARR